MDTVTIASFAAVCGLFGAAYGLSRRLISSNAAVSTRIAFIWFAFDGLIHLVFEGSWLYLSLGGRTVNTTSGPFAELCKPHEYAETMLMIQGKNMPRLTADGVSLTRQCWPSSYPQSSFARH